MHDFLTVLSDHLQINKLSFCPFHFVLMEPLQVRFHPKDREILASGSLDHEVHVWNANTSECIGYRDFCNSSI